jgi:hypothetical protein
MNKLSDNQKRMIVVGVGLVMILFGLMQAIFKFEFVNKYKSFVDDFFFVLMIFAAMLLFSIWRKPKQEQEEPKKIEEDVK